MHSKIVNQMAGVSVKNTDSKYTAKQFWENDYIDIETVTTILEKYQVQ